MRWNVNVNNFITSVNQPKSFFVEEFDSRALRALSTSVSDAISMGQQILPIYIETEGGDAFILNGMISIMDSARKKGLKFATVVAGKAFSAGAYLFAYGDKEYRFMGESATLMFHGAQMSNFSGKFEEIKSVVNAMDKMEKPFLAKISKHLGKKADWLERKLISNHNNDWFLNSEDSMKEGISNHTHLPVFTVDFTPVITIN